MSTSQTPPPGTVAETPAGAAPAAGDPSMEDILASIRRILSEDEAPGAAGAAAPPAPPEAAANDGVLVLDPAMMVAKPPEPVASAPEPEAEPELAPERFPEPIAAPVQAPAQVPVAQPAPAVTVAATDALIAPETAAAAASSVDSLLHAIAAERGAQVHHGGPTIEDIVREELRPLLKAWLDANLPPMVERLVRVEIERVVRRVAP